MMVEQKLISLLGLAQKAGKIVSGETAIERTVKAGKAKLLLIAANSSAGTKKKYYATAKVYNLKTAEILSKEALGLSLGKPVRAALAVTDEGFGDLINKLLDN